MSKKPTETDVQLARLINVKQWAERVYSKDHILNRVLRDACDLVLQQDDLIRKQQQKIDDLTRIINDRENMARLWEPKEEKET